MGIALKTLGNAKTEDVCLASTYRVLATRKVILIKGDWAARLKSSQGHKEVQETKGKERTKRRQHEDRIKKKKKNWHFMIWSNGQGGTIEA